MACQQGHNQSARLLLMANAKTEAKNSYGDTPLHTAARYGHAGVARILLSARSQANQVNKNHDTPLHIAAAMGRRKLTKIFMQNWAEPAIKNKQNETAMDIALRKDLIDIQELIANPPPPPASSRSGGNPRHAHTRSGRHAPQRHDSCELLEQRLNRLTLHHHRRHRHGLELAVDVPENTELSSSLAKHFQLGGSSPMSPDLNLNSTSNRRQLRPKTLTNGLGELQLLGQQVTSSNLELRRPPSPSVHLLQANGALAPDARAHQDDWAVIMERSAHPFKAKETLDALTTTSGCGLPDSPEVERIRHKHLQGTIGKRRKWSPTNSVRSSLVSRSRGRLVVGPRTRQRGSGWSQSKSSLLVRRPNLGTCVGKLSLLRLRNLVAARTTMGNNEPAKGNNKDDAIEVEDQKGANVALGRRQERLERLQREQLAGRRALNGIKLSATRPLASLADETQLYAIPKKFGAKAKQQQTNVGANNNTNGNDKAYKDGAGPALISDGCHSSLSSLNRAATPLSSILSSRDGEARTREELAKDRTVTATRIGEEPAVVGVHSIATTETQPDLGAPGYSAIGDSPQQQVECRCDAEEEEEDDKPAKRPNINNRATSKLRSLFQFNNSNNSKPVKVAASAIAGGYYAYSPVVQSSSELRHWQQQQQQVKLEHPQANDSSQANESSKKLVNGGKRCSWLKSKFISTSKSSISSTSDEVGAKLIAAEAVNKEDGVSQGSTSMMVGPERQVELIRINGNTNENREENQIMPKGGFSAASAELIAAQKSLAAAAAAKVKRTRMSRVEMGACHEEPEEEEAEDAEVEVDEVATERGHLQSQVGMLTVKTSDEYNLHHHWPPSSQADQKYLMIGRSGLPMNGHMNHHSNSHRSGSNSVGMSDSSPSNNGAESDNSMQTATTGSLNADNVMAAASNTLATTIQQPLARGQQNSSSLGILSRILLNNSSKNYATTRKSQDNTNSPTTSLSSPAGSQSTKAPAKLDQLGSRSRCPIVVATKSNELPSPRPPPLPAKSVLKPAGSFQTPPLKVAPSKAENGLVESMNGLPRVASYSQISSSANQQQQQHLDQLYRPPSHLAAPYTTTATNYLPYGPPIASSYSHPLENLKYLNRHHLSHHDLSSTPLDLGAVASTAAINYEYYLEAPVAGPYASQRYHYMQPGAGADTLYGAPQAAYDDSVYIPAAYKHHYQLEIPPSNHPMTQYQHQQQARPKSSLDNFHLSGHAASQTTLETTNGLQRQISATIDHKQQTNVKIPGAYYSYSSTPYKLHQADSYLYTSENSIYASDRTLAATFHTTAPGSQLTVLPTCDESPYHRGQSSSTTSSASPMKQLGAVGGTNCCRDSSKHQNGCSTNSSSHQQQHHEGSSSSSPAASTSSAVSSLLSSPAQRQTVNASESPPTPMARQQQEQQRNSWTPTVNAPFKSLVQINQPTSSSCDVAVAVVAQQAKSHQSSQSATTTTTTGECDFNSPAAMTDLPQQVAGSVNGRSHLQLNGQSPAMAIKQTRMVISNGTNDNSYKQSSPTTITANNCQLPEHCNGSNNKTVL